MIGTQGRPREWFDEAYWNCGGEKSLFAVDWYNQEDRTLIQDAVNRAGLIARLLPVDPILDVGCGVGHTVEALRLSGREAVGVDWSHAGVRRRWTSSITEACADHLPFRDGMFGGVTSWDFLEHIPLVTLPAVIQELARCGRWQFHAISACLNSDIGDVSWMPSQDRSHCSMFSAHWWQHLFQRTIPGREWAIRTFPAMQYTSYLFGAVLVWCGEGPAPELLTRYAEGWRKIYNQRQANPNLVITWPPGLEDD